MSPEFSIITPVSNALSFLPRCCASVRDQEDVAVEHVVVDGVSDDGTVQWLEQQKGLEWISEPDAGMYDAVNKGLRRSRGEILAYLNADEQYLSGTLGRVGEWFRTHPDVDVVYGDMLVIRPDGTLLAFRKSYPLRWPYVLASHLYVPTCAVFWRRRIVEDGFVFNSCWRAAGDAEFLVRILRAGYKACRIPAYLSCFTYTGGNLGGSQKAFRENLELRRQASRFVRFLRPVMNMARLVEKVGAGAYIQSAPIAYSIYLEDADHRVDFVAPAHSWRWPAP